LTIVDLYIISSYTHNICYSTVTHSTFQLHFTELNPNELAPLDEFGVPKYKGRKRGRKPKKRKRALNPNRQKRQHTAYTLFVKEIYPDIRAQYTDYQSKDIIGLVARQWATVPDLEKAAWKERALASHAVQEDVDEEEEEDDEEEKDDGEEEEEQHDDQEAEEEEEAPKRRRGRPRKKP